MANPDFKFDSGVVLTVEREDNPGQGDFVERQMDINTYSADGAKGKHMRTYDLLLDKVGPKITVRTWISDADMIDLEATNQFSAIVKADAPGITEQFIVELLDGGRTLALDHRGQLIRLASDEVPYTPEMATYELGLNASGKMVRVNLFRFPPRG